MKRVALLAVFVLGCPSFVKKRTSDAGADDGAAVAQRRTDEADAAAQLEIANEAWKAKMRKSCGLKPDGLIFPATKRRILEDCNRKIESSLPNAKFPPLPPDTDRTGLNSADGCRYFIDSYVDTQGVRARFRCKYDPTMLGTAEWETL